MAYLNLRLRQALGIISQLEGTAGLRFTQPIPHAYMLAHWPRDVPIGGWTSLPPHLFVKTLLDHWEVAATGASPFLRLLRPALFVMHERGVEAAIDLLVDLQASGLAIQDDVLERVIMWVLLGRAAAEDDREATARLIGADPPSDIGAWQDIRPRQEPPSPCKTWPPVCRRALARLIERSVAAVSIVRESADNDRWFVGQLGLRPLLFLTRSLIEGSGIEIPIGARAVLSQLEEIEVDAGVIRMSALMGLHKRVLGPSVADQLDAIHGDLGDQYRDTFGEDWGHRLYEERLKIPTAVGVEAALEGRELPPEWQGLSWRVARPFTYLFMDGVDAGLHRAGRFPPATILGDPDVRRLFDDRGITDDTERREAIGRQYRGVIPQSSLNLSGDRALAEAVCIAHLRSGAAETRDAITDARKWLGVSNELALSRLDEQVARYPWNGPVRFTRALVHTRSGSWQAARDDVVAALILAPEADEPWWLLDLVLKGLGHSSEAAIAASVRDALRRGDFRPPRP